MEWKLIIELRSEGPDIPVVLCTRDGAISLGWTSTEGNVHIYGGPASIMLVFYADMCKMYHKYIPIELPEEVLQIQKLIPDHVI